MPIGEGDDRVYRILESISDGFFALDEQWRFTYLNEVGRRLLRPLTRPGEEDLIGRNVWESFPAAVGTIAEKEYRRAVREQKAVEFDYQHADEEWFRVRAFPIRGGGLSVYFDNITEKKRQEAELASSQERYRTLFDSIDEGFCVIEVIWNGLGEPIDYRYLETNRAFAENSGLRDAVGRRVLEFVPEHEQYWFDLYGRVARTGVSIRFEHEAKGLNKWFSGYAFRFGGEGSSNVGVLFNDITKRRRAELEMARLTAESRARLAEMETLLDLIPVGIAIALDRECTRIEVNSAFAGVLGISQDANASMTAPPEERPRNFRVRDDDGVEIPADELPMQVAARKGVEVREREVNILHENGRLVRLLEYAAPLFDEQGVPRGSVGAFVDITERRATEARQTFLLQLEEAVRPLVHPEEIVATAARSLGEYLKVDRCAYADVEADGDTFNLTGDYCQGVASIVGRYRFADFGSECLHLMREDEPYVVSDIEKHRPPPEDLDAYRATEIRSVICVPLHKSGRLVGAMAVHQKTPRNWTGAEVALVQQVANRCWEALERAKVARELTLSEDRFRKMADLMPQVVWAANKDGSVFYFNERWFAFTGLPEGSGKYDNWATVLHPDDVAASIERWNYSVRTGEPYEIRYRWRDHRTGEYRWFLGRALPLRDEHGEILHWYGTSTDINDLVHAEETARAAKVEAERASRAKDEFLAALSHELRTPLTPVLMMAAALQEEERLPADVREQLSMIRRNIELEARLIDDLLDLTRIARGKLPLREQICEAHSLVELALEIVRDDALARGISLELQLRAERTRFRGDPARLQQVFWNLLKNAVRFTPAGGQITLCTRDDADHFVFEVVDTGIGIPEADLERIFQPFEQASVAPEHRFGGLGLGLSISKAIVEMHGGSVTAESPGLNRGATLRVALPAPAPVADAVPKRIETLRPTQEPAAPMRILLVEDHPPTRAVLTRLLMRAGHDVVCAASVAEARGVAAREKFDVVVSDIGLPDGTGVELMRSLKAEHGLTGIALSGYGMEEDLNRSMEAGFIAHLTKPVDFTQVVRALSAVQKAR